MAGRTRNSDPRLLSNLPVIHAARLVRSVLPRAEPGGLPRLHAEIGTVPPREPAGEGHRPLAYCMGTAARQSAPYSLFLHELGRSTSARLSSSGPSSHCCAPA